MNYNTMESETQKTLKQLFCTQLIEFMDDILTIFPNNLDLKTGKTFIIGLTKVSKKKLVGIWKTSVVDVYENEIMNGDKEYFINKDYKEDLGEGGTDKMMSVIEDVRKLMRKTTEENKNKAMKYLQNLTKICKLYYAN
tara:strand:+ start:2342 stop:2755 length:414 start_codon:yes stop_codon:yes gene_type:complete